MARRRSKPFFVLLILAGVGYLGLVKTGILGGFLARLKNMGGGNDQE